MTRGQKGCYIYCLDEELANYFKLRLAKVYNERTKMKELLVAEQTEEKGVFIVQCGPGTGKSVLAINLLVQLIQDDYFAMYITKNSAPRPLRIGNY